LPVVTGSRATTDLIEALGPVAGDPGPGGLIGVEHEYRLSGTGGRVDFRELIHDLPVVGLRLDPGDANAYRCQSGMVVTCDDEEAEVVSPPVVLRPGFSSRVAGWAERGRDHLAGLVPDGTDIAGYSTHLSAAMPDPLTSRVADLHARTFAPALMLMLDRADSHGVFVRPRPYRLELCGEYAAGVRLAGVAAFFVGSAKACAAALGDDPEAFGALPPSLAVDAQPATGRPGTYVGRRRAFGFDLYKEGRRARLPLAAGGTVTAQEHIERAWEAARLALGADAAKTDLDPAARIVAGSTALGIEQDGPDEVCPPMSVASSPFGGLLRPRRRPGFGVSPHIATWGFTVFRLDGRCRTAWACVPRSHLDRFLDRLDAGRLDDVLGGYLEATPGGRVLANNRQTREPALWDDVASGTDLLPSELGPTGSHDGSGAGGKRRARPAKPLPVPRCLAVEDALGAPEPAAAPDRGGSRHPAVLLIAAALMVVIAAAAAGLLWGSKDEPVGTAPAPVATTTSPVLSTTPVVTSSGRPAPSTTPVVTPSGRPAPSTTVPRLTTTRPLTQPTAAPTSTVPAPSTSLTPSTSTLPTTAPDPGLVTVVAGCGFTPPSLNRPQGSSLRFRNSAGVAVSVLVTAPAGGTSATFPLTPGQESGPYVLAVPGTYFVECNGAGGGGGMQVMVP